MNETEHKIAAKPHQIVERVAEFMRLGDLEGIVTMFHPDCRIAMDPTQAPMEGHDAVRAIFEGFAKEKAILEGVVSGEMINGDVAILQGSWTVKDRDGATLGGGQSTEVATRLESGGWVYFIDCPIAVPAP